jgi:tetratricopeptide (TPR) repeat protein
METEKKAIQLVVENKHEEALQLCPKYPDGYLLWSLNKDNMKSFEKQQEVLNKGLAAMPGDFKLNMQYAKLLFQWDQNNPAKQRYYSNNIQKSEKIFHRLSELKPNNEEAIYFLGLINSFYKHDYFTSIEYLKKVIEINPGRWAEMWNLIAKFRDDQGRDTYAANFG